MIINKTINGVSISITKDDETGLWAVSDNDNTRTGMSEAQARAELESIADYYDIDIEIDYFFS